MAWVEPKGTGFRVRHRHPDGSVETLGRYDTKVEARRHVRNFNPDPIRDTPEPEPAHSPAVPADDEPTPRPTAGTSFPPPTTGFHAPTPATTHRPRRTAPALPRQDPTVITPIAIDTLTLGQWVEKWSHAHQVAPTTAARYESHLRIHILPKFGDTPIDHISRIDVKAWAKELSGRMATSSAHSILTLLSTVMSEAQDDRHIPNNPCQGLRLAHRRRDEKVIASPLQVLRIADRMDPVSATMVITAAYTGMRWGELAGLGWHNVLFDQEIPEIVVDPTEGNLRELAGKVWLDEPKTENSERTIALPPFLAKLLTAKLSIAHSDTVFTGARGAYLRRSNFRQRVWDPAANGEPSHVDPTRRNPIASKMTFHGLRHSHKTWMKEDGIDGFVQDKRLGHATPSIGDRYSHITPIMTQTLIDKLEARYQQSVRDFAALPMASSGYTA